MTTTVVAVMHDAHVRARASFVAAVAARTAMVQAATTRRAAKAARNAAYAANRRATKAQRAANVVAKEAAEKHASAVNGHAVRVANRAAAKAYMAPAMRASKKAAACEAKAMRAVRNMRILAIRASRAAAKATAAIKATVVAIDKAYALHAAPCGTVVAPATAVCVAMHDAHVRAYHATIKAANKAANKARAAIKVARVPMNDASKRASITLACTNARAANAAKRAADAHAVALVGSVMSQRTIDARATQGAEQREWNAALKAHKANKAAHKEIKKLERSIMGVTPVVQVRAVAKPIVAKLEGAHAIDKAHKAKVGTVVTKQASYPEARGFRTSPLHPVMAPKTEANKAKREAAEKAAKAVAARKAAKKMSRQEWELQKAHRQALKEQYMALRVAKVNRICTEVWYKQGVWVDTFLVRACNDSDHDTRVAAMTELLAIRGVAA